MSIQALRDQRAAKASALKDLVEKADWSAERDQPIYDSGVAEIEAINAQIANHQRLLELAAENRAESNLIEASQRSARDNGSPYAAVFAKWLRGGDKALNEGDFAVIRNTMSTTTDSEGGYAVPTETAGMIIDALKAYGGVRRYATVISTPSGAPMEYPTSDGTTEEGELIGENTTATDSDPSFGTLALPVYKYSSKVITVPIELLQDASADIEAFIRSRIGTRLGRITNKHYTTGTGSAQPNGFVTAASVGVTASTGGATTFSYGNLVDLVHSVDPAYREGGQCVFAMSDAAVKVAKKIVDGQSRPIFLPAYDLSNQGQLDTILGYPVQVNQHMAAPAANAKSVAFGDFGKYVIRDAMALELFRFADSPYLKKGQIGFLAWLRTGGNLMDNGGAVKTFVHSAS